ncbi:proteasome subunit beta [Candidatus Woesearchaeota archaeon]|nr:proteasome subunit beta [Candidatus Woesearchaeota archaeon]
MEENIQDAVKKGTTTVGIVCKDGIVLAADKRASAGYMIANKKMDKIHSINDNMAVTMAGLVSDAQLIVKLVRAELRLKKIRTNEEPTVKETANLLGNILYQNIRKMSMVPGIVSFLLGGKDDKCFGLYEIGVDGSIADTDDYVSTGSGSVYAYGVLETLYSKEMTLKEGVALAKKAINAAIQRDMPTGNGIDIFTITNSGVKKIETQLLNVKIE